MVLEQISGNQRNVSSANTKTDIDPVLKGTAPPSATGTQPSDYHRQPSLPYRKLSINNREIRLLCLDVDNQIDANSENVIASTSLVYVSLNNNNIQYFALSYPWGSGEERDRILVDGASQSIGSNLATMIRDICARRQGQPLHLWIDKLCINQDDLDEKAWQIDHMSKIYSGASKTLVWLGIDSTTSAVDTFQVLASLEHLTQDQFAHEMKQLEEENQFDIYVDPDCQLPTDNEIEGDPLMAKWTCLHSILSLPWWGRRWVIQEAFFSEVPMVTVGLSNNSKPRGSYGIHMDKFAQLAVWHQAYVSNNPRAGHITKTLFSNCPFYPLLQLWTPLRTGHSIHQELPTWLRHTASFNQTLDTDIVFALVPLSSANDQLKIDPDYKGPVEVVFKRIFSYLVRHPSGPGLLQPFVLSANPRTFDLPSWCEGYWPSKPRLQPPKHFKVSPTRSGEPKPRQFNACGAKVSSVNSPSTPTTVATFFSVQGSPFDDIAFIIPINFIPSSASNSPLLSAIKTCQKHFNSQPILADPYHDSCGRLTALCMTLMGGNTGDKPINEWWWLFNVCLQGDMGLANASSGGSGSGSIRQLASRHDAGRQNKQTGKRLARQKVSKGCLDISPVRGSSKRNSLDPFFKEARNWCYNRCLIVTKRGHVGLAPLGTQVGDHVAILYGEAVPGVLRRWGSGTGQCGNPGETYSLVGEAYVHGIMYGEAVEDRGEVTEIEYLLR